MRVVLDLQGVQTPGSRNRGMGRYSMSLAKSMLQQGRDHEFHAVFNGAFMGGIDGIRDELGEWIPQDRFHIFPAVGPTAHINAENDERRIASEICREAFIANLQPDFVHITSLFEGLFDDSISSIGRCSQSCPVAVTLYDLIPLIHHDVYLQNPDVERWYEDRIMHLRRADLLLAISRSSAEEAIDYLNFPAARVMNIGADADPQFEPSPLDPLIARETHARLGIAKPFVMYTGGIDWRKNIEGLMAAYAKLPASLRKKHQLVVVCAVQPEQQRKLEAHAATLGLNEQEVLFTGFVSEADLIALYKTCKLFAFPSWHEGFGLPPLEAMRCGAPVIGGNRSSLPEVIGLPAALFDPVSEKEMQERLEQGLTDEKFRSELVDHASKHTGSFSWQKTGKDALTAIETFKAQAGASSIQVWSPSAARKRMAFVSPIPPAASGIADYSAELIPELSRHYELEIVVKDEQSVSSITDPFIRANFPIRTIEWMQENFAHYDRVVYQFGNSDHHNYMLHALPNFPGVVVLHDFYLSGMISFEQYHYQRGDIWFDALYRSHGYSAIAYQHNESDLTAAVMRYPANRDVVTGALGMIVHSQHSKDLAAQWLGGTTAENWHLIPLMRDSVRSIDRDCARQHLGFGQDDFVVSSFGFVNPTKESRRILEAWLSSPLAHQSNAKLVFVGTNHPGAYGEEMDARIKDSGCESSVRVTGWTDHKLFRNYLAASDVAVQLRTLSRGETSAAALDAMNYRLATIVNRHGSMEYLPEDAVFMLPDEFTDEQLREALIKLSTEVDLRADLASRAKRWIETRHAPRLCGDAYMVAIERSYEHTKPSLSLVVDQLRPLQPYRWSSEDLAQVAVAAEVATCRAPATSYLDVTYALHADGLVYQDMTITEIIKKIFAKDLPRRLEPVYFDRAAGSWRYARKATLQAIGVPIDSFDDDLVVFAPTSDLLHLQCFGRDDSFTSGQGDSRSKARVVQHWILSQPADAVGQDKCSHPLAPTFREVGYSLKRFEQPN
jgi:glycosyltransferase involved in cell wall biosynthesis